MWTSRITNKLESSTKRLPSFQIIFAFEADKFRKTVLTDQSLSLVWVEVFQYWLGIRMFKGSARWMERI